VRGHHCDLRCAFGGMKRTREATVDGKKRGASRKSKDHETRSKRVSCPFHHRMIITESDTGVTVMFTETIVFTHENHPPYRGPKMANVTSDIRKKVIDETLAHHLSARSTRSVIEARAGGIVSASQQKSIRRAAKTEKSNRQWAQAVQAITELQAGEEIRQQVTMLVIVTFGDQRSCLIESSFVVRIQSRWEPLPFWTVGEPTEREFPRKSSLSVGWGIR
jgi:hypothetical protein